MAVGIRIKTGNSKDCLLEEKGKKVEKDGRGREGASKVDILHTYSSLLGFRLLR